MLKAMIPSVTLDTNLIMEFWKKGNKVSVVDSLLKLADNKQLDLAVTTRIEHDVPSPPLAKEINRLPLVGIGRVASVFRLGYSKWGSDRFGSPRFLDVQSTLANQMIQEGRTKRRPDWRDWDHLHGHYLEKRNVFLTWDGPILHIASELHSRLEIVVMKPEEFLSRL